MIWEFVGWTGFTSVGDLVWGVKIGTPRRHIGSQVQPVALRLRPAIEFSKGCQTGFHMFPRQKYTKATEYSSSELQNQVFLRHRIMITYDYYGGFRK